MVLESISQRNYAQEKLRRGVIYKIQKVPSEKLEIIGGRRISDWRSFESTTSLFPADDSQPDCMSLKYFP